MKAQWRTWCAALVILVAVSRIAVASEAQNAFNEGTKFYRAGKFKEAIAAYDRAIRAAPTAAEPYNNRGLAYYKLGQNEAAVKNYDEAIKLDPKLTDAYYNRANA